MSLSHQPWYKPEIGPRLKPVIERVYKDWSGLTNEELIHHLHRIRDEAWQYGEYPCVGEWIFLLPSISTFPEYPMVLDRARAGASVLDLGCSFGQDLRLLAANGVPTENMHASDISAELWNLGYELFRDQQRMKAYFVQADVLDTNSDLERFNGSMDIIIACQFFHLFDWENQVVAIKRVVKLSRPGAQVIGYQQAQEEAQEMVRPWGRMFLHDIESFQKIWREVEAETGSRWEVKASLVDLSQWGMEESDFSWMVPGRKGINFVVTRYE